jgi:hypothetical protein
MHKRQWISPVEKLAWTIVNADLPGVITQLTEILESHTPTGTINEGRG